METTNNTVTENKSSRILIFTVVILAILLIISVIFNIMYIRENAQWTAALSPSNTSSTYVPQIQSTSQLQSAETLLNSTSVSGSLSGGITQNSTDASSF
jgi:cytoskeletal protein RodZ